MVASCLKLSNSDNKHLTASVRSARASVFPFSTSSAAKTTLQDIDEMFTRHLLGPDGKKFEQFKGILCDQTVLSKN